MNHLKRIAAFKNPEFYRKQALRLSTYSVPRIISCFDVTDEYLAMPRGCEDAILSFLNDNNVKYTITDETSHGKKITVTFTGKEREEQTDAINALLTYSNGVLHATTAFGKTVTTAILTFPKCCDMLTRFGFRAKMYYLCPSEVERALNTGLSPLFLPNIRDVIQSI